MPRLSIGLPVLNGGQFLELALRSVLAQTWDDLEIIISDNASTDDTQRICREFAARDPRIRYHRLETRSDAITNFKFVVEKASGEFFTWLAYDDELQPDFCATTGKFLVQHPSFVCVSGDYDVMNADGQVTGQFTLANIRVEIPWKERIRHFFYQSTSSKSFMCVYGLFRRQALFEALRTVMRGPTKSNQELPILSRVATRGEVASLPVVLRRYRYHAESVYGAERTQMAASGWKGRLLNFYGRLWYKGDQVRVLFQSPLAWRLKFSIVGTIILYHLRRMITLIVRRFRFATPN